MKLRPLLEDASKALVEDRVAPARTDKARHGDAYEQVSQRGRVQHAGVVHDSECHVSAQYPRLCFCASAASSSSTASWDASRRTLYAITSAARTRRCEPTLVNGISPFSSS